MDDLDTGILSHYLKIWADKWKCTGEIKGGTVALNYKRFIVTSNYTPAELWGKPEEETLRLAICRRFILFTMPERDKLTWKDSEGYHESDDVIGTLTGLIN